MGLFQKSVLKSYLNQQNKDVVEKAYVRFKKIYDSANIEEIKKLKEEEYQTGFFNDIFINVLGYTLRPTKDFNFKVEQKNVTDSKKADGAILNAKKEIIGVVELKSTATKNLDLAKDQAFNYKHNHSTCKYVIVSNFDKVQFYINDSVNKEEFSLFNMTREDFYLFYLCLAKDNILSDLPLKIKESSISEEKQITAKFYKDYTAFRDELYLNIKKNNQQNQLLKEHTEKGIKLTLFKKTQKLLDRFLFIFFAEDTLLLKHNFNDNILKEWEQAKKLDIPISLYDRYKTHFNYLDKGRAGTTDVEEIFAYNGGLFKPDPILDEIIKIDDDVLYKHSKQLSTYNFDSQVDVNILGHIFENSLNEIENITAEIEGDSVDKQKTKRKKDGIFYTPKYITKYIVDNTIGKLCDEKKAELKLNDIDTSAKFKVKSKRDVTKTLSYETEKGIESHSIIKKTNLSAQAEKHLDNIEVYRNYLLGLTIVDPACGSGAFLNQALVFLINEHKYLDELQSTITGSSFVFPNIENVVLEKNIYGVDINEESVEIAKLSLWLRTAQPRRKLNDLSNNIKCGNSLIDIKTVAGDKAFKWESEFPHVFAKGGFDVVIGNPPYVPTEYISENDKLFLEKTYNSAFGRINLYPIFYEKGILILKDNGILSYITPYTILKNQYFKEARKFILENTSINILIDFKGNLVFEDAAVDSIILSLIKKKNSENKFHQIYNIKNFLNQNYSTVEIIQDDILKNDDLSFNVSINEKFINKVSKNCTTVSKVINFNQGIITGGNSKYITNELGVLTKKMITGSDFNRYTKPTSHSYIIYDIDKLHRPRKKEIFEVSEKILLRQTGAYPICTIDLEMHYTLDTVHNGLIIDENYNSKYLLSLLNSKLLRFLYENSINEGGKVFAQVKIIYIDPLPIKIAEKEIQKPFIIKVEEITSLTTKLRAFQSNFIEFFQSKFKIENLTTKLQNWYLLEFSVFLKELQKANVEMSLSQEAEWLQYFNEQKKQAETLKLEIDKTDKEIDNLVYNLYGLTATEIELVENSIN